MEKGKLDEELDRMSAIAGQITVGCLLLCNESFASTNEREGSEIARQIIRALTGRHPDHLRDPPVRPGGALVRRA